MTAETDLNPRHQPLFMQIFPIWLILTSIPLAAFGLDQLINQQGYNAPKEYLYLAWQISAPLGSSYFTISGFSALAVSALAIVFSIFFVKGVKAAYWGSIFLLFFGMAASVGSFHTFGFIYAVPVNLAWLWFLFNDKRTREFFMI